MASIAPNFDAQTVNKVMAALGNTLLRGYSLTLTIVNIALLPFIVFYLAVDFDAVHLAGLKLIPAKHRNSVRTMGSEIDIYVAAFVRGQMIVALVLLVLYALGLGIVGVQLWFLLAVIAGLANMIPYLGTALGITLSSIMALVTFGDFSHLLAVWIVFGIIQVLEGSFITPKIVGDKVGLSPLIVILAIFAGGSLFGLVGIMLAVPGAATIRVLGRNLMQWIESRSEGVGAA